MEQRKLIGEYERLQRISEEGTGKNFWNYVERVTGTHSLKDFLWRGVMLAVFSMFPTVVGSVLRGVAYRTLLGRVGSGCFIEKSVRFYVPKRIYLGDRVLIGEGSLLDAGSIKSKIEIGDDVVIPRYCTILAGPGNVTIEEHVNIGTFTRIDGHGNVRIGKNTLIARNVEILTGNHIYKDPAVPIRSQGTELKEVRIGEDVWIGSLSIILPGVRIGNGAVIGAGAVVTEDIPQLSLAAGVPARIIRKRE